MYVDETWMNLTENQPQKQAQGDSESTSIEKGESL